MSARYIPKYTFLIVLALVAALAVACSPASQTGQNAAGSGRGITVVGQGEAFGQPDEAQVQVGVEIFMETVSAATAENEATIQRVIDSLAALGIAEEDIQTTNYSLWAEQIYGDRGPEGIAGYRVTNQVNVKIRDIDKVGEVLQAVTAAGANSIYGISFSVADPAALEAEARAAAIADARERAETLASLSGVTVGEVVVISEIVGQPIPYLEGRGGASVAESAVPSISPGQLSYHVQIQVTFAIQ